MKKPLIIGLIVLLLIAGGLAVLLPKKTSTAPTTPANSQSQPSISAMQKQFEGYKGTEYDKVFLASMITHHTGAVEMAQMALTSAKHQEIKDLASNIIADQNKETTQMKAWQIAWGYAANDSATPSVVGQMQSEMDGMMGELNGKTGDAFDSNFLTQMMLHHQSAIDMAKPAATNASRQEVKTLASNIIAAQTKELAQMKQWQTDWNYKTPGSMDNGMHGMKM